MSSSCITLFSGDDDDDDDGVRENGKIDKHLNMLVVKWVEKKSIFFESVVEFGVIIGFYSKKTNYTKILTIYE